mgnify:CR=1 FL=1
MIYVVAHDGGCEGLAPPSLAFAFKADAIKWCEAAAESFVVCEVPIYPEFPVSDWLGLKPVWPERKAR